MIAEGVLDREYEQVLVTIRHYEQERVKLVYQIYFFLIAVIFTAVSQGIALQKNGLAVEQSFVFWLYFLGSISCLLLGLVALSVFGMVRNWTVRIAEAEAAAEYLRMRVLGDERARIREKVRDNCDQKNPNSWLFRARSTTDMLAFMPFIPALVASVWVAASATVQPEVLQSPWHAVAVLVAPVYLIHFVTWNLVLPWAIFGAADTDASKLMMGHVGKNRIAYRLLISLVNVTLFLAIAAVISNALGMDGVLSGGILRLFWTLLTERTLAVTAAVMILVAYTYRTGHWLETNTSAPD